MYLQMISTYFDVARTNLSAEVSLQPTLSSPRMPSTSTTWAIVSALHSSASALRHAARTQIAITAANRKRDKMPVDVGLTEYEKTELGDMSPDYRYLL